MSPNLWSMYATLVAVPLSFIGLDTLVWFFKDVDKPFAAFFYAALLAIVAIPFAIVVGFGIAPRLCPRPSSGQSIKALTLITSFHVACVAGILLFWVAMNSGMVAQSFSFLGILWYLAVFLTPASVVGCVVYAVACNSIGSPLRTIILVTAPVSIVVTILAIWLVR